MPEGKRKFIEDAAKVIDGRVLALEAEISRTVAQGKAVLPGDRSAILEAKHCARLIRSLALRPYRGDPYHAAERRWARGEITE